MKYCLILFLILLLFPISILAAQPNNIYGIHLAQPYPDDLKAAANLVNSNGGDWGYVTLVIQENDRDTAKWQQVFDSLRQLHLIPIIRLATQAEGQNWRRPDPSDDDNWISFLNSLNWVVKNRYVILFNEPNHGSEWGGEVDEKSYAKVAYDFAKKFKQSNSDYFVMLAGMDASAPSWLPGMEDEQAFLQQVFEDQPDLINYLDGIASHSYPNPGFAGSPYDSGRGSVRTYQWEEGVYKTFGAKKDLPVFITETGWGRDKLGEQATASDFQAAFEDVWSQDKNIWAVTPFVLNYQSEPFLQFSWEKPGGSDFYSQYQAVQSIPKIKGDPEQVQKGSIDFRLPKELVAQSHYQFVISLKNDGQAIWGKKDDYELRMTNDELKNTKVIASGLQDVEPFQQKQVVIQVDTGEEGDGFGYFVLTKNGFPILKSSKWSFKISPLPSLSFNVSFWPWGAGEGRDFEIQIFDINEKLVFDRKGVVVKNNQGVIKDIKNIALNEPYRVVILKKGYLPRQTFFIFAEGQNKVEFKSMLPFDINGDGKFDFNDIKALFHKILGR